MARGAVWGARRLRAAEEKAGAKIAKERPSEGILGRSF
jgi:hypothetical protein